MNCPRCKSELQPAGELESDGDLYTVYQCDDCVRPWHFDGEVFDVAMTFAVSDSGHMIDPESLEPLTLN